MKHKLLNIYKLKKHFKKGLTPLLCALTVFNFCCINAKALDNVYLSLNEPFSSDYAGYMVLFRNNSFESWYLLTWNISRVSTNDLGSSPYPVEVWLEFKEYNGENTAFINFESSMNCHISVNQFYFYNNTWTNRSYQVTNSPNGVWSTPFSTSVPLTHYYFKGNVSHVEDYLNLQYINVVFNEQFKQDQLLSALLNNSTTINSSINSGNTILSGISSKLDDLINSDSQGSISDVSNSGITSVENKENALIGDNVSTNDLNVSINPNAASVVWGLIDDLTTSNAKVFGMFVSILTIAVIGLILNR